MTKKEILKKAIEKAVKNGYMSKLIYRYVDKVGGEIKGYELDYDEGGESDLIFSHEFAKAFWGEEHQIVKVQRQQIYCQKCGQQVLEGAPMVGEWQYHLQNMVIEPDPIKYLEKFI